MNYRVNAYDLSEIGCKLEFVERPSLGEVVWVKFPDLASIESTVRWIGDFAVGVEFNSRVDGRVLQILLQRLR